MRSVNFKGSPISLLGPELRVNDLAPRFKAKNLNFETVEFPDFLNSSRAILFTVPSLDTPVCHDEACFVRDNFLRFKVPIVVCSKDLPFAQSRWVKNYLGNSENMYFVSDFPFGECGKNYGVDTDLGLLARAVFCINEGKLSYIQIVEEITQPPDYKALEVHLESFGF